MIKKALGFLWKCTKKTVLFPFTFWKEKKEPDDRYMRMYPNNKKAREYERRWNRDPKFRAAEYQKIEEMTEIFAKHFKFHFEKHVYLRPILNIDMGDITLNKGYKWTKAEKIKYEKRVKKDKEKNMLKLFKMRGKKI